MYIICIQETCRGSSNSSDQKVIQQSSEIMMLNVKLETLRKENKQLIAIHSKCMNRKEISVSTKTDDQVCTIWYKFLILTNHH